MSKKSKRSKYKNKGTTHPSRADALFDLVGQQIFRGHYAEAVTNCQRLLNYLPPHASLRADVLAQLGVAQAMLQNFPESYEAFTEALALQPNEADLWYNRSRSSSFTLRIGRALRDIERAVELNTNAELAEKYDETLQSARSLAEQSRRLRGPDFTVDQLIEQEELFQQGLKEMERGHWDQAGQAFEASIAMGDCLPQPWGNLGISLMMQERYDEAEEALKRALVIDPDYSIAQNNLASLPEIRRSGPPMIEVSQPFKESKMKQSIMFVRE